MELWMGIIILLFIILLFRHFLLLKGINEVRQQLESIHESEDTNQLVTNPHNFLEINKLIQEINVDIKRNQESLIQSRVKEQALKEQMTNISHDLRTPLASMLGYFELMNDEDTTKEERKQYLKMIQKRAKLLRVLLDNYYDLAKIESDEKPMNMKYVDVSSMLAEILATFYYDFSNKYMEVEVVQDVPSIKVLADKEMLNRVFINLIQNVLKHGQENCKIIHQTHVTKIKNKVSDSVQINIEQVFNRLYSADKTRNSGNTGIGLTIARLLIEKMGHKIDAELDADGYFSIIIYWKA